MPGEASIPLFDVSAICFEEIATARLHPARDVMVRLVTTASDDTPVAILGSLMRRKLKYVAVFRQGRLVGIVIVSREDLLHALMKPHETV